MQTTLTDPKSFFAQRGGLHDARIRRIAWNSVERSVHIEVSDLNANLLGLPEYTRAEPGIFVFYDAQNLTFGCDALQGDIQRIYGLEIEEGEGGNCRCTLRISPGGRLTFQFSSIALLADASRANQIVEAQGLYLALA